MFHTFILSIGPFFGCLPRLHLLALCGVFCFYKLNIVLVGSSLTDTEQKRCEAVLGRFKMFRIDTT